MTDTAERSPIISTGALIEWIVPFAFLLCAGWAVWHTPAYILSFIPPANESLLEQMSQLHYRKDVTPDMPALFGGYADILDWLSLVLLPIIFVIGVRTVRIAPMEFQDWRKIDKIAIFVGRITMILIISMTLVMLYEVFLRYAIEAPTLWANELTLWLGGYLFLLSGLYAMQQRCHIRIFLLYDVVPRWMQRTFDVLGALLICVFAVFLIFGSYKQVFVTKFYRWEMFGTAFDPPIPATVQPTILIVVALIAIQAVINVISDWNLEPVTHSAADDIDEDELEMIKKSVGSD
ncbi:TRAP-type mannitol/chloroaromatic compound transport system permease small subunit [Shimia isoporae]|uniref:TRAP transporter small permease protein n=1 Tax=Shimia isoporae TaxID=647720 RepID=A0A4R1N393_9RHOB|nr:TRAP transporter small permease [Shimia isoporae]TCL01158.1 TRAP-type mannitol/chloroaromatic compound transport system permease small subunit [Shimia isoporae]